MPTYLNGVEQGVGVVNVGGLYGINVETLTGNKTLVPGTDEIYQYLDEGGADRIITLDTASATIGDRFVIKHNGHYGDSHYLEVKQGAASFDFIFAKAIKEYIFDGTNWLSREIGTGDTGGSEYNVTIGYKANARSSGVALGYLAVGYDFGVGVGYNSQGYQDGVAIGNAAQGYSWGVSVGMISKGHTYGVGVGYFASGYNYGVAVGARANTNEKLYSIALGYYSKCERTGETSTTINGDDDDQENNVVQGRWEGELAGGAGATEIFCGGQANERFTIRPSSVLAFDMIITARDNVDNEVARYSVHDGLIKRDGANNTAMVLCTVTVDHEDDATWDCTVTADDVNEALIITVTGDGTNITQWVAVMNGVETHF